MHVIESIFDGILSQHAEVLPSSQCVIDGMQMQVSRPRSTLHNVLHS